MTSEALLRVRKVFDEQTAELENKLSELKSQISTAYLFVQSMTMKRAEEDTVGILTCMYEFTNVFSMKTIQKIKKTN